MRESFEARCGTPAGYQRHRRTVGEPACDECLDALKRYRRRLRAEQTPPPLDPMNDITPLDIDMPTSRRNCGPWALQAACLDKPTDWFFPDSPTVVTPEARALCGSCPVQPECLEHAVRVGEPHGIWGGRSEQQLSKIRSTLRRGAA